MKTNCILKIIFFISIGFLSKAQTYEIRTDDWGKYFPYVNGKLLTNIKVDCNKNGKKALIVNNKAVTAYEYDVMFYDDWKRMVVVYQGKIGKYDGPADGFGKYGLIDKMGKTIVPVEYDIIWNEITGAILYKGKIEQETPIDGYWGFVGKDENIFLPCTLKYNRVDFFNKGLAKVHKGIYNFETGVVEGFVGFIDSTGKEVVNCKISTKEFDIVGTPSDQLIGVGKIIQKGTDSTPEIIKFGFCNYEGKIMIPLIYDKVDRFKYGLCKVYSDDRKITGCKGDYLNEAGKKIDPNDDLVQKYWDYILSGK